MNTTIKIVILFALLAAVGGVFAVKYDASPKAADTPANAAADPSATPSGDALGLPRLVSLGAGKCIPCKAMEPIREELRSEYAQRLRVDYHDVWQNPQAGQHYGIRLIPTLIYFDAQGRELGRTEGFMTKQQILETFARWGVDLNPSPRPPAEAGS